MLMLGWKGWLFIHIYIISSVMHAFWLNLTYDLLEDRRIDDIIVKTFFNSLLYKTNRFQVAVRLFSNRSQRTSKCGKNISDTLGCASWATTSRVSPYTSLVLYPLPACFITEQSTVKASLFSSQFVHLYTMFGKII